MIEWIKFQKVYTYLESIFTQSEMKKPLAVEVKDFEDNVNKIYKTNVKKIVTVQSITQLLKQKLIESYLGQFRKQNEKLIELNKKINDFLDSKRETFPRFYFVANDELIYILANYDSPTAVQSFVGKMFENINRVDFGDDHRSLSFNQIISREGETMSLKGPINIKLEAVEKWMKKLEDYMKESIFKSLKEGYKNYDPQNIK